VNQLSYKEKLKLAKVLNEQTKLKPEIALPLPDLSPSTTT
jgi:hypothetical protein